MGRCQQRIMTAFERIIRRETRPDSKINAWFGPSTDIVLAQSPLYDSVERRRRSVFPHTHVVCRVYPSTTETVSGDHLASQSAKG